MNKNKLQEILQILSPDGTETDFKAFDEGVDKLKKGLKEKIQAKTLDDVNGQLRRVKEGMNLEPLLTAIKDIDRNFDSRIKEVAKALAEEVSKFDTLSRAEREENVGKLAESSGLVDSLREELATLKGQKDKELGDVLEALKGIPALRADSETSFNEIKTRLATLELPAPEAPDLISPIKQQIEDTRNDLITRINNHGGNMNRSILVGGDTQTLTKYTDINLKAGAGTLISYAANNTTKYTDITITATGTGSGITRSVNSVAISTLAGSSPSIDYVYLAAGTLTITLPTSVGNSNLYTIKNIGAGVITIATTGGETIDGSASITLPVQYTSVDLISNNSGNWDIT